MPLTHFTRVDLPAPLSPTSAVTSPGWTQSSTSRRTCTGPKLLSIPRTSSRGVAATADDPFSAHSVFRAELCEGTGTEVVPSPVPVSHAVLDVLSVDDLRPQQHRRYLRARLLVLHDLAGLHLPAGGERDGELRGGVGL